MNYYNQFTTNPTKLPIYRNQYKPNNAIDIQSCIENELIGTQCDPFPTPNYWHNIIINPRSCNTVIREWSGTMRPADFKRSYLHTLTSIH